MPETVMNVCKTIDFCAGHRLPEHPGKCRHLHGHNYRLQVTLAGRIGSDGMVVDFSVFNRLREWIEQRVDHAFLFWAQDPELPHLRPLFERNDWRLIVMDQPPTAEAIASMLCGVARELIESEGVHVVSVRLWETPKAYAELFLSPLADLQPD
jgi:6-pyruvoyltetrahydropterin/6-carboxytetrahydropterin synthase